MPSDKLVDIGIMIQLTNVRNSRRHTVVDALHEMIACNHAFQREIDEATIRSITIRDDNDEPHQQIMADDNGLVTMIDSVTAGRNYGRFADTPKAIRIINYLYGHPRTRNGRIAKATSINYYISKDLVRQMVNDGLVVEENGKYSITTETAAETAP